jgi:hypothetical protein
LADAPAVIEAWRIDYNTVRPHSWLAGATPHDFAMITEGGAPAVAGAPCSTLLTPGPSHYPCSGTGGQVRRNPMKRSKFNDVLALKDVRGESIAGERSHYEWRKRRAGL